MDVFGVRLIGLSADTGHKLLLTLLFFLGLQGVGYVVVQIGKLAARAYPGHRIVFWTRQLTSVILAVLFILAILSIWFQNSQQATTVLGLVTLGLTVALQKAVTAFAGYLVILRGKTFTVGDRIMMGGVRGDVVALGFIQTRIMEMGQPPGEQKDEPAMWVTARQPSP
jgi:small-conductance mechanosensitive channel